MSDNNNNLKNRFDNFEPEVDESRIEQNWQKIKDKLPEEKSNSKKGFFMLFLLIGFVIAIGTGILLYFNTSNHNDSTDNSNTNNTIAQKSTDQNISNNKEGITDTNEQNLALNNLNTSTHDNTNPSSGDVINSDHQNKFDQTEKTINKQRSSNSNRSSIESNLSDISKGDKKALVMSNEYTDTENTTTLQKKIVSKQETSKGDVAIGNANSISGKSKNKTLNTDQLSVDNAIGNISKTQNNDQLSGDEPTSKSSEVDELLETKVLPENMLSYPIYSLPKDSFYHDLSGVSIQYIEPIKTDEKTKKLSGELLVGPLFTTSKLNNKLVDSSYTEKYSSIGFSGNIGINYAIKPRVMINAQYFYNQTAFNSSINNTNNIELYRSVNQTYIPPDTVSYLDTTKKYFEYNSTYGLRALNSHQFGIGLNYRVMDFKKLFLETGLAFNIKQSRYNYEKIGKLNTDTFSYQSPTYTIQDTTNFNQTSTSPVSNYPDIDHSVKKDFKYSFGLMPSISVGYNLNTRLSLLIKGSYYFDLGQNKINNEELLMKIKQNSLFLHFGVRVKL